MVNRITDLPLEILIIIMSLLGKTCNGAASVAKAMLVNKLFREAADKVDGLAEFRFRNMKVQDQHKRFQYRKGLIYNCARAGNSSAQYLLAKVILATCTQLMNVGLPKEKLNDFRDYNPNNNNGRQKYRVKALAASFLCHFNFQEPTNQNPESSTSPLHVLTHRRLVRVFLLQLIKTDILFMSRHLNNYAEYFLGSATYGTDADLFTHFIHTMGSIVSRSWGSCLVRYRGNCYVKFSRESLIIPPQQLEGLGGNEELIDWIYADFVFEEVRRQAIYVFDLLIPQLH